MDRRVHTSFHRHLLHVGWQTPVRVRTEIYAPSPAVSWAKLNFDPVQVGSRPVAFVCLIKQEVRVPSETE